MNPVQCQVSEPESNHRLSGLGAISLTPVWFPDPVAKFRPVESPLDCRSDRADEFCKSRSTTAKFANSPASNFGWCVAIHASAIPFSYGYGMLSVVYATAPSPADRCTSLASVKLNGQRISRCVSNAVSVSPCLPANAAAQWQAGSCWWPHESRWSVHCSGLLGGHGGTITQSNRQPSPATNPSSASSASLSRRR